MIRKIMDVLLVIVIVSLILIFANRKNNGIDVKDIVGYSITYKTNNSNYILKTNNKNIKVFVYEVVECFKEPCNPINTDIFNIEYSEENKDVLKRIISLNSDNSKELIVYEDDLLEEDAIVINKMVKR